MTSDMERLPQKLSPSRAKDFVQCPQKFKFKVLDRLPTKNSVEATRGTIAHTALEELFKLPKDQRTLQAATDFIDPAWEEMREHKSYADLVEEGSAEEQKMLAYARQMVSNYFKIEDPTKLEPVALEHHPMHDMGEFTLHGKIDRLMEAPIPERGGEVAQAIDDYKTGKPPRPKYLDDAFYAMRLYALLMYEETGKVPYMLRLIYLKETGEKAFYRVKVDEKLIERARRDIEKTWTDIKAAAASGNWPTKTGPLCNWCDFKSICPAFAKEDAA